MKKASRNATVRKSSKAESKKSVIGSRKACKADGTGLSHYILLGNRAR
jgi:modified peptide precursor CbpA